jgi:N-hydroxyarylamine O-acetyltransferase
MTQQQKIKAYLPRIGFTSTPHLDFDTLHDLQRQHLLTVPYENIDITRNIQISLEIDDIFDKVVTRRRGGYCFELNALFAWLLRGLGFSVTDYFARFLLNEPVVPMRRHHVLGVSFANGNEKYLCDVGVGLVIPRMPIKIYPGSTSSQNGEIYKLEKDNFLGYILYDLKATSWRQLYSFTEEVQISADYAVVSYYCEKHPASIFNKTDMVHIFTENGRKSVDNRELRIFTPSGVDVYTPSSEEEYKETLKSHFGIII